MPGCSGTPSGSALRKLPLSQAREPDIAFGNPLLDGGNPDGEQAKLARVKQRCPVDAESPRQHVVEAVKDGESEGEDGR